MTGAMDDEEYGEWLEREYGDSLADDEVFEKVLVEQIRRDAAGLDDFDVDRLLAHMVAQRDLYAARGRVESAESWNEAAIALADVRTDRTNVRHDIEEMTGPPPPPVDGKLTIDGRPTRGQKGGNDDPA